MLGDKVDRRESDRAHLCILKVSHEAAVNEALVEYIDECVVLDMGCEVKLPVRCLHAPFFLELGGCLPIVCNAEVVSKSLMRMRPWGRR